MHKEIRKFYVEYYIKKYSQSNDDELFDVFQRGEKSGVFIPVSFPIC